MKTRLQVLWLSILLALIALGGLTWLQLGLLRDSSELRQQILDGRLRMIVFDVVRDLETMEAAREMPMDSLQQLMHWHHDTTITGDSGKLEVFVLADSTPGSIRSRIVRTSADSALQYQVETEILRDSSVNRVGMTKEQRLSQNQQFIYRVGNEGSLNSRALRSVKLTLSDAQAVRGRGGKDSGALPEKPVMDLFVAQVIHRLTTMAPRPLRERVNRSQLDSLFRKHLRMAGLELMPEFAVYDSSRIIFASAGHQETPDVGFITAPLFPFDMGGEAGMLRVRFPGQEAYLWRDRWKTIAGSGLFMSMLAATVAMGLIVIRRQDRVRQRTQEFIANLTHEFTTPVSTISLAVEALSKAPTVTGDERSQRMVDMIGSENRRMRAQVQKILQLAQLEQGNIELAREEIQVNALVTGIAGSYQLAIEQRRGTLTLHLSDEQSEIRGDRTHIGNLISNLIDNAIKYSEGAPVVTIVTGTAGERVSIAVSDQGIGIPLADQGTIFQKFVRGSTGNIHDVKGFGIGLSYVKAVAEAHFGTVELHSRPGSGTTMTVFFPRLNGSHQRERND